GTATHNHGGRRNAPVPPAVGASTCPRGGASRSRGGPQPPPWRRGTRSSAAAMPFSWEPLQIDYLPLISKIRTIFITGLPGDVKERELHNLLRWFPGFEASQINFKAEQPMGFALFSTAQHAVAAKDALQVIYMSLAIGLLPFLFASSGPELMPSSLAQDLVFDAETKSSLHTEMAKKNLFVKRGAPYLHVAQPGFKQMKILRQERNTVCFIEFEVSIWRHVKKTLHL
ncbi:hypothetical protein BHE74_00007186, partial [Ensete ventricosum]